MRRLIRARDGAVAVETALVSSLLLVPLLLGLWDVAQIAMAQAQLGSAAGRHHLCCRYGFHEQFEHHHGRASRLWQLDQRVLQRGVLLRADEHDDADDADIRVLYRDVQQRDHGAVHEHHGQHDRYDAVSRALSRIDGVLVLDRQRANRNLTGGPLPAEKRRARRRGA
jgi:TadE-like protein